MALPHALITLLTPYAVYHNSIFHAPIDSTEFPKMYCISKHTMPSPPLWHLATNKVSPSGASNSG